VLANGLSATEAYALQTGQRAVSWRDVAPPAPIYGLADEKPTATLELSRAWLTRVASVRQKREALQATGELDGLSPLAAAARGAALSGVLRIPVIPVRYADVPEPFPTAQLEARLFGRSVGDTLSYADYWTEVSGGLLRVEGAVAPWVALRSPAHHYLSAENYGWAEFGRIGEVRSEALRGADAAIDFRAFDNDGPDGVPDSGDDDGFVDFVAFVYALPCPGNGRTGAIWPHRATMHPVETADTAASGKPIRISDYVILPAVDLESCGVMHVGLLAHETGHALGLPDLYDYDGSSFGIGDWGLMGTGSHGRLHSPAHLSAWEKEQLGWVRVSWLREDSATVRFAPVERDRTVFRYDADDGTGRYLLLENRRRIGSDKELPGEGLLVWQVDPEPGELGIWNRDERRTAVGLARGFGAAPQQRADRADPRDPLPGVTERRNFRWTTHADFTMTDIVQHGDIVSARIGLRQASGAVRALPAALHFAALTGGDRVSQPVALRSAEQPLVVTPTTTTPWLTARVHGDTVVVTADPERLAPGAYHETVQLLDAKGVEAASVVVSLDVAPRGVGQVIATELPWGWGLAARGGMILQASYGRDPIDARPRPRVLELAEGRSHPVTLARLPADAVYAPVAADANGDAYIVARADERNFVYRIGVDGQAALLAADVGNAPAYGATRMPDGNLLVSEWTGQIHRILRDGATHLYTQLQARIYQLASDDASNVYAALLRGDVARLSPDGVLTYLDTGFAEGRLVTIAASADGWVYAAERGGQGRIVRFAPDGHRDLLYRDDDAGFYGLALDGGFLYALDLHGRQMLRLPVAAPPQTRVAANPQSNH
jgi:M6 family metalloprotease-like protein